MLYYLPKVMYLFLVVLFSFLIFTAIAPYGLFADEKHYDKTY